MQLEPCPEGSLEARGGPSVTCTDRWCWCSSRQPPAQFCCAGHRWLRSKSILFGAPYPAGFNGHLFVPITTQAFFFTQNVLEVPNSFWPEYIGWFHRKAARAVSNLMQLENFMANEDEISQVILVSSGSMGRYRPFLRPREKMSWCAHSGLWFGCPSSGCSGAFLWRTCKLFSMVGVWF